MSRSGGKRQSQNESADRFVGAALKKAWERLHRGDREPFPDARRITRLAGENADFDSWVDKRGDAEVIAEGVQSAWREFHAGHFARAIELGNKLGGLGAIAANKAAAIHATSLPHGAASAVHMLEAATRRGEQAVAQLPECVNTHYTLALVLGRYSQRISVVKALAGGLGGRVRALLERTLELEPRHADAHIAFGLYHAEIVGKVGGIVAGLTYGASQSAAIRHFRKALELTPESAIAHIEYAQGLLLLDARAHRAEATRLYELAAACEPADAMETLDVERARRSLG